MRVIAGMFRGRRLKAPRSMSTRPTTDSVREAWFNILGADLAAADSVLDLFAGSGALGIEALSRGARRAVFVERNPRARAVIRANLADLDLTGRAEIVAASVNRYISTLPPLAFDVAFADPPYDGQEARRVVDAFLETPFARVLGVEHRAGAGDGLMARETRTYGEIALSFWYAP
jgi:16S rRNA (guanine966-N2)-methyltransferase